MKKKRPHVPLEIQLEVAYRQVALAGASTVVHPDPAKSLQFNIDTMLDYLFGDELAQLDHDPALGLREYNAKTGKWKPDANDPDYLVWRERGAHRTKTIVRGEHGARSDVAEMKYRRKVIRNAKKRSDAGKRKKAKVQARPVINHRVITRKQAKRIWPSRPIPKRSKPWPTRTR